MLKIMSAACVGLATLVPTVSMASDETSGGFKLPGEFASTVTFISEYSFRGISQTDKNPAVQGSIDWSNDLENDYGVYLGVWGSNVNFNDGNQASTEFDIYGGLTHAWDAWTVDLGGIYYAYPGAASSLNYDFFEVKASLGYDFGLAAVTGSVYHSPEYFGKSGDAQYYHLGFEAPLPEDFTLTGHIARQNIEKNATFGAPDYADWSLGLGYNLEGFDVSLQYVDTDIASCSTGCDGRAIFGVSRSF